MGNSPCNQNSATSSCECIPINLSGPGDICKRDNRQKGFEDADKFCELMDPQQLAAIMSVQRQWRGMVSRSKTAMYRQSLQYFDRQHDLGPYSDVYMIATNRPENDEHWNDTDAKWVGRASMAKRHRFLIRRDLHWRWFNSLVFGMIDADGNILPKGEVCADAIPEIEKMKTAALLCVKNARACGEEWSENIGLFFHVYGHNSVNSLHMHIVDLDVTGPGFAHMAHKNIPVDMILEGLKRRSAASTKDAEVVMSKLDRTGSKNTPGVPPNFKSIMTRCTPVLNDVETYLLARECLWVEGGPAALKAALEADGYLKKGSPMLTTSTKPFNVFARLAHEDSLQRGVIRCLRFNAPHRLSS